MNANRTVVSTLIAGFALLAAGCASTQPGQYAAARNCKVVPADFIGKPTKTPSAAERAEAALGMSRLAAARGGYGIGSSLLTDLNRECS